MYITKVGEESLISARVLWQRGMYQLMKGIGTLSTEPNCTNVSTNFKVAAT